MNDFFLASLSLNGKRLIYFRVIETHSTAAKVTTNAHSFVTSFCLFYALLVKIFVGPDKPNWADFSESQRVTGDFFFLNECL